jgi:DNA-binding LytR/AlgR family response regulator
VKVIVVDDEPLARARLLRMLERVKDVTCVGEAADAATARALVGKVARDVVMLDIEMPGTDGLSLAHEAGMPSVIFTTAHQEFAADAFDVDAIDYLVKPIRQERLERALEKVRRRSAPPPAASAKAQPEHTLAVHEAGSVRLVDASKVRALRAVDKYTAFMLDGVEMLVRESLDTLTTRLAGAGFSRVHRAALVRRDVIIALAHEKGALVARLDDGTHVPVSRRLAPGLRRELGLRR